MSVGQICNREVIVVNQDEEVIEAAKLMRAHHVGDVIVVEERSGMRVPVGILTDRDIVIEVIAEEVNLKNLTVKDIMSFELETALEGDDLLETIERMRDTGVRRMPVVNASGGLEGILTVDDIIDLLAEQLTDLTRLITKERLRESRKRP